MEEHKASFEVYKFQKIIRRVNDVVTCIYHSLQRADVNTKERLPTQIVPSVFIDETFPRNTENFKRESLNWVLKKAFEDFYKSVEISLRELYCYLKSGELKKQFPHGVPESKLNVLIEELEEIRKRNEQKGILEMLGLIENELGLKFEFREEFASIRNFRNCLVHRDGIVSKKDFDKGQNYLSLKFRRMNTYVKVGAGEFQLLSLELRKTGDLIAEDMKIEIEKKELFFHEGQELLIDIDTFNDLCTALQLDMDLICQKIIPDHKPIQLILKNPD